MQVRTGQYKFIKNLTQYLQHLMYMNLEKEQGVPKNMGIQ